MSAVEDSEVTADCVAKLAVDDDDSEGETVAVAVARRDAEDEADPLTVSLSVDDADLVPLGECEADPLEDIDCEMSGDVDMEREEDALPDGTREAIAVGVACIEADDESACEGDAVSDSLVLSLNDATDEGEPEPVNPLGELDAVVDVLAHATLDAVLRGDGDSFAVGAESNVTADVNVTITAVEEGRGESLPPLVAVSVATMVSDGLDDCEILNALDVCDGVWTFDSAARVDAVCRALTLAVAEDRIDIVLVARPLTLTLGKMGVPVSDAALLGDTPLERVNTAALRVAGCVRVDCIVSDAELSSDAVASGALKLGAADGDSRGDVVATPVSVAGDADAEPDAVSTAVGRALREPDADGDASRLLCTVVDAARDVDADGDSDEL